MADIMLFGIVACAGGIAAGCGLLGLCLWKPEHAYAWLIRARRRVMKARRRRTAHPFLTDASWCGDRE